MASRQQATVASRAGGRGQEAGPGGGAGRRAGHGREGRSPPRVKGPPRAEVADGLKGRQSLVVKAGARWPRTFVKLEVLGLADKQRMSCDGWAHMAGYMGTHGRLGALYWHRH